MPPTLVDTHALLWWLTGSRRLPKGCRERLADPEHTALVSAVSAWEVSVKRSLGKLDAPDDLLDVVVESGLEWIPIEPPEADAAGRLPMHHRDPFDRLLVAQALARGATLMSHDEALDAYRIRRYWG